MSDTDRRAIIACDIDLEPCGPVFCSTCLEPTCTVDWMHEAGGMVRHRVRLVFRECNESERCPHHGGMGSGEDGEDWTVADQRELDRWRERTS